MPMDSVVVDYNQNQAAINVNCVHLIYLVPLKEQHHQEG